MSAFPNRRATQPGCASVPRRGRIELLLGLPDAPCRIPRPGRVRLPVSRGHPNAGRSDAWQGTPVQPGRGKGEAATPPKAMPADSPTA